MLHLTVPKPIPACARGNIHSCLLQLVLDGINYRDYTFLTYGARGQPPQCVDGGVLSHYQCLKQMVILLLLPPPHLSFVPYSPLA